MDKEELKALLREVLEEGKLTCPVKLGRPNELQLTDKDRLDTGDAAHKVYTRDLFTLGESPRLGAGLMVMEQTTFPWTLQYDEIDYVISGNLTVYYEQTAVTAGPGEVILIPRGSSILFSVPNKARFLYVTYPADWQNT